MRDLGPGIEALQGGVVAVGNFDGVHRGHQSVIATTIDRARALGRPAAVLTMEPHPRSYFQAQPLFRLTPVACKLRLLASTGLDGVVVLTFDAALAALTAEDFASRILVDRLKVKGVVIGFDFHFGQGRVGSPEFLKEKGAQSGFSVDIVPPLAEAGRPVSSGAIRADLEAGRVEDAATLLGYPWFVSGSVIHGEKRGRDLGFPTANVRLDPSCALRHGIYAVRVGLEGKLYEGVASFGRRPTFDNGAPLLEIFLFDFSGSLYDRALDVAFIGWIRPEMKFDSIADLVTQMDKDSALAREALAHAPAAFPQLGPLPHPAA
ncbi:MAG: bifunctional riboflavin kinase/FAD synthetase [Pseudorhodoplanes sp.]